MIRVPVALEDQPYEVLVGAGARHRLLEVLPVGAERAAVVTQPAIGVPVERVTVREVRIPGDAVVGDGRGEHVPQASSETLG